MKKCFKCGIPKEVSQFSCNPTKKDGLNSQCKDCHSKYKREHYLKNRQKYINKASKRTHEFVAWFQDYKSKLSCSICGDNRWWVLDFHHRNSNEKEFSISNLTRKSSKSKLLGEIKKCDVLCSNCHRDLHYKQDWCQR